MWWKFLAVAIVSWLFGVFCGYAANPEAVEAGRQAAEQQQTDPNPLPDAQPSPEPSRNEGLITAAEFGGDWGFTVDTLEWRCLNWEDQPAIQVWEPDGDVWYPLNGVAKDMAVMMEWEGAKAIDGILNGNPTPVITELLDRCDR